MFSFMIPDVRTDDIRTAIIEIIATAGNPTCEFTTYGGSVDVDWGDGNPINYPVGPISGTALGTIHIVGEVDLYRISFTTDTYQSIIFNNGPFITEFTNLCNGLTNLITFDVNNVNNVTNMFQAFKDCSGLTSFPLISTNKVLNFRECWSGCSGLTTFPLLDLSSGTDFEGTFNSCSSLTDLGAINTSSGTAFSYMFQNCTSLTCLSELDTTNSGITSLFMFDNTPLLVAPDVVEQSNLADFPGISWSNSGSCPPLMSQLDTISDAAITSARGITISGTSAYVTGYGSNSFAIFDISVPTNLSKIGQFVDDTVDFDGPTSIAISGDIVYPILEKSSQGDISNFNVLNPSSIITYWRAVNMNANQPTTVKISGNYAFMTSYNDDKLTSILINKPDNQMSYADNVSSSNLNGAYGIAINGNTAYVVSNLQGSITSIDITDPTNISELYSHRNTTNLVNAKNVAISGNYAYVSASKYITVIDISDRNNLVEVGTLNDDILINSLGIAIRNNIAYCCSTHGKLVAVDITDPANMSIRDSISISGAYNVEILGTVAFVTHLNSLTAIDISQV